MKETTTMRRASLTILAVATLVAVAGCAKKPPKQLPPPPPSSNIPTDTNPVGPGSGVGTGVIPGSRADFVAQAGSDTIHFDTDKYDIASEAQSILSAQARWLVAHPNVSATIEGHCDERGTREYNLALGERRANAAKNFLVSAGVSASRLSVISYGKERPVAEGSDEESWAQNRRAVTVVPQ
jgi:peptidoglycan-associated lipoprotein